MEMPAKLEDLADDAVLLQLVDISLGGIGMFIQRGNEAVIGSMIKLRMTLEDKVVEVDAMVRHTSNEGALVGLEFIGVQADVHNVINHYVSELAERGAMA